MVLIQCCNKLRCIISIHKFLFMSFYVLLCFYVIIPWCSFEFTFPFQFVFLEQLPLEYRISLHCFYFRTFLSLPISSCPFKETAPASVWKHDTSDEPGREPWRAAQWRCGRSKCCMPGLYKVYASAICCLCLLWNPFDCTCGSPNLEAFFRESIFCCLSS